jgi:tetratricopeptide (TPR) repeat protein
MLRFLHPEYLWWLSALPVLAGILALLRYLNRKRLERLIGRELWTQLVGELSAEKQMIKQIIVLAALALLILAGARPQLGTRLEEVKREGIDIFVALDVSLSMKAEDIRPSRLEKAKRDVSALLKKLSGDRVGLIVFAGDAYVQFPLTADYSAADLFISAVDVDAVPTPGTQIAAAVKKALQSFPRDLPTQKAIFIVSDGENTEGDIAGAIAQAKDEGVRIYAVGMGTPDGAPIPLYSSDGRRLDYKRDRSGNIVLTRLDEPTLQEIAAASGGSYRRATSGGNEIDDIYAELAALEKTELGTMQVTGYEEQYQYPLALAVIVLLLELLIGEQKGMLVPRMKQFLRLRRAVVAGFFLLPLALHGQTVRSHISEGNAAYRKGNFHEAEVAYQRALAKDPSSLPARNNIGAAHYKQDRYEEAVRAFSNAAALPSEGTERAKVFHNLGNALLKSGKLPESIEAYKQALRLNPADDDARYNLQYARQLLKNQPQQKDQRQSAQDQKENQQQKSGNNRRDQQQQEGERRHAQSEPTVPDQMRQQQLAQQKNQMPRQEAERILEAMKNSERLLQKQLRRREGIRTKTEKDW